MNHFESLTKKLHALLPELLELNDGCGVNYVYPLGKIAITGYFIGHTKGEYRSENWYVRMDNALMPVTNRKHFQKTVEIIGRPLGLEHVLKACDKVGVMLLVSQNGYIFGDIGGKKIKWAFGLHLDQQSPETIEWLDNLIPESGYDKVQRFHDEHTFAQQKAEDEVGLETAKSLIPTLTPPSHD